MYRICLYYVLICFIVRAFSFLFCLIDYSYNFTHVHVLIQTVHPSPIPINIHFVYDIDYRCYMFTNEPIAIFPVHMYHQKQRFRLPQAFNQTRAA